MLLKTSKPAPMKLLNFHVDAQTIALIDDVLSYCGPDEKVTKSDVCRSALDFGLASLKEYFETIKLKYDVKES